MKKYSTDIILNLIGLILICVFFLPLFYPHLSLFVTPEVGVSDLWQFNVPVKLLMSQAIDGGFIPWWTSAIGTGFPILAESQMGFFNGFSLVLYFLFPHLVAFNLQFVTIYFFSFVGMYFFLRHIRVSYGAAFLGAITFTFSGFYITHISHQNMILTASYIPWIFLLVDKFFSTKRIFYALIGILFMSQQIFAGYAQIAFITWIFVMLYVVYDARFERTDKVKSVLLRITAMGVLVGFALALSAIQVIPTSELINRTARKSGLSPAENIQYSYPIKHFKTMLDPFALGSPKDGTYPHYNKVNGSIFWENTGYIGLIPLLLAGIALSTIRKNRKTVVMSLLLISAALLMTGKYSPFYFIHTLPPFNKFRVPSRYIIMFIFSLCTLGAIGLDVLLDRIKNYKRGENQTAGALIGIALVTLSIANVFMVWHGYHLVGKASEWFSDPQTAHYIKKKNTPGRIYSVLGSYSWTDYFLKNGWGEQNNYVYFRNWLSPNYNILAGIDQYDAYVGKVLTNRQQAYNTLISAGITEPSANTLHVATASARLMGLASVRYVVAPEDIRNDGVHKKFSTTHNPSNLAPYSVYENDYFIPRAHVVYNYSVAKTLESIQQTLVSESFDMRNDVVLEKEIHISFNKECKKNNAACKGTVDFIKDSDMFLGLTTSTPHAGLLVLADSYYPGWEAYVDGAKVEILAANLNQRAIVLPAGKHSVRFEYTPTNVNFAAATSLFGYVSIILLLVFAKRSSRLDTFFRTQQLLKDR